MPKGPLGLPRLTNIGPLVRDIKDAEIDDVWVETKRETYKNIKSEFLEYGSLSDDFHDINAENGGEVIRVEMKYQEWDTVLGDTDFFTYTAGKISYAVSNVGYIHKVKVNDDFRRLGIATELVEMALDDAKNEDVSKVYTKTVSEAGEELMDEFGFKPHNGLNSLNPQNQWKVKEM